MAYYRFIYLVISFAVFVSQFSGLLGRFDPSDRRLMYFRVPFVLFSLFGRFELLASPDIRKPEPGRVWKAPHNVIDAGTVDAVPSRFDEADPVLIPCESSRGPAS